MSHFFLIWIPTYIHFHLDIIHMFASDIQSCKIPETIYPIGLKFSGIVEGANRIVVLKFQSNLTTLSLNVKTGNSGKTTP